MEVENPREITEIDPRVPGRCCPQELSKGSEQDANLNDADRRTSRASSISFWTIVGAMFMLLNARCAHHVRPPA
jgi:hypothetical protein